MVSSTLRNYARVAKRWAWMVLLGMLICGGTTYVVSKLTHPVYRASALLVVNIGAANQNTTNSLQAVPTFAQLITSPTVLDTVVAQNPKLTLQQLTAMTTVKPQPNTQVIELDVENGNPQLAMQLANEISQSFAEYSNAQLSGIVQILPAVKPTDPIRPKPLQDAAIGALVGLSLAIALSLLFEWYEDRLKNFDQIQETLGAEVLTVLPTLVHDRYSKRPAETTTSLERYRLLCASLNTAQAYRLVGTGLPTPSHGQRPARSQDGRPQDPPLQLMITSASSGEGTSTIAVNLASSLAKTGKRVLLVDANLRRPMLDSLLSLNNSRGLSTLFSQTGASPVPTHLALADAVQKTDIPNLLAIPAGGVLPNAAELLQSQQANSLLEQFKHAPFDYVLFDTPPLFPVADAQILAAHLHNVLLVVDVSKTPRRLLLRAKQVLRRMHTTIVGIVVNKSNWGDEEAFQQYRMRSTKHPVPVIPPVREKGKGKETTPDGEKSGANPHLHKDAGQPGGVHPRPYMSSSPGPLSSQPIVMPALNKLSHPGMTPAEWHSQAEHIGKGTRKL